MFMLPYESVIIDSFPRGPAHGELGHVIRRRVLRSPCSIFKVCTDEVKGLNPAHRWLKMTKSTTETGSVSSKTHQPWFFNQDSSIWTFFLFVKKKNGKKFGYWSLNKIKNVPRGPLSFCQNFLGMAWDTTFYYEGMPQSLRTPLWFDDRLIDWVNVACTSFPFFLANHLIFGLHFCFLQRLISMPIGRLSWPGLVGLFPGSIDV